MTIKEFFSFKKNRLFWGNILAIIIVAVLLVFGVLKVLEVYTRHGQAIIVPKTEGMTVREADAVLRKSGLRSAISDSLYVKEKRAGSVLDCTPSSGKKVKEGRIIYLTINTFSVPLQPVPDVADNSSLRQAHARMLASGFKLTANESMRGEKDWVYKVKYKGRVLEPGEKVPVESILTLVVGDGTGEAFRSDSIQSPTDSVTEEDWF